MAASCLRAGSRPAALASRSWLNFLRLRLISLLEGAVLTPTWSRPVPEPSGGGRSALAG